MRDLILSVPDHCLSFYFPLAYNGKRETCYLTVDILKKVVVMATKRLKCELKAIIPVFSGERVWHMGLWCSLHIF